MKLLLIKKEIEDCLNHLKIIKKTSLDSDNLEIIKIRKLQQAIYRLEEFNIFPEIESLKGSYLYSWPGDMFTISSNHLTELEKTIASINKTAAIYLSLIDNIVVEPQKYIISVQLPPNIDLLGLSAFYKQLDTILIKPLSHFTFSDSIQINSFENGSKINDFFVENKVAFGFLIAFITSISPIFSTIIESKSQPGINEIFTNRATDEEIIERIDELLQSAIDKMMTEFSNEKNQASIDSDVANQLKASFKSYIEISEAGATINVYLNSDDVADNNLLPLVEYANKLVENQIKLLALEKSKQDMLTASADNGTPDCLNSD